MHIPIFYMCIECTCILSSPSLTLHTYFMELKVRDINLEDNIGLPRPKCILDRKKISFFVLPIVIPMRDSELTRGGLALSRDTVLLPF